MGDTVQVGWGKKKICLFLYLYAVSEIHKTTFGGCEQELFLTKGPCSLAEYAISLWWIPKIISGNLGGQGWCQDGLSTAMLFFRLLNATQNIAQCYFIYARSKPNR